jgi:hypothetical protein
MQQAHTTMASMVGPRIVLVALLLFLAQSAMLDTHWGHPPRGFCQREGLVGMMHNAFGVQLLP